MRCSLLHCVTNFSARPPAAAEVHSTRRYSAKICNTLQHTATHCNTLQHTATHCNTLQHAAIHCNTQENGAYLLFLATKICNCKQPHFSFLLSVVISSGATHTATHCNTLQHTTTHGNTLQHNATQALAMGLTFCSYDLT